jgi:hypothetical protein
MTDPINPAGQKHIEGRMIFRGACIKRPSSPRTPPCPTIDQRRIEEAAKAGYSTREPGHLAVEHVEKLATIRNDSAQKNLPNPNNKPQPTLIAHPTKVRMFGLICPRASQRTIASMIRWPASSYACTKHLSSTVQDSLTSDHMNAGRECQDGSND